MLDLLDHSRGLVRARLETAIEDYIIRMRISPPTVGNRVDIDELDKMKDHQERYQCSIEEYLAALRLYNERHPGHREVVRAQNDCLGRLRGVCLRCFRNRDFYSAQMGRCGHH